MTPTYALTGSSAFNERLHLALQRLTADVRQALGSNLVALILGGGYGRGEGAVWVDGKGEAPYNDLDLVLVVRRRWGRWRQTLEEISHRHEAALGIDVDFSRPLTLRGVRQLPHWLMWQDLLNGHVVLDGPDDLLRVEAPAGLSRPLPVIEASRLLLNRGAGLVWALRVARGHTRAPDGDFIRRNYYKCLLALGDAALITHGCFSTPYRGRDDALKALATHTSAVGELGLMVDYREALAFKFAPHAVDGHALAANPTKQLLDAADKWCRVFLYVEGQRVGRSWPGAQAYAAWPGLREPEQHTLARLPRNLFLNARLGGFSSRYPREQLFRRLPLLLAGVVPAGRHWDREAQAFLKLWEGFN